jgi:hypothetical protein
MILASGAIVRDELRLDWSYGEIGSLFVVSKGIVSQMPLGHQGRSRNHSQVTPSIGDLDVCSHSPWFLSL